MSTTDFSFVESKAGARIHRATCKKLPATAVPLEKVLDFAPGTAAQAKPAGCCKPKIDEVLAEARAALAAVPVVADPERKHFRPDIDSEPRAQAEREGLDPETFASSEEATISEPPTHVRRLAHEASAKAYARVIFEVSREYAERVGLSATFDPSTLVTTLTGGSKTTVDETADLLSTARRRAGEGLRDWKRTDPKYRSYPKAEAWGRKACWDAEVAYFQTTIRRLAYVATTDDII